MKVIDYNPAERVPSIMESDIDNKIIISITDIDDPCIRPTNYFSYIKKDGSGLFHFYGIGIESYSGSHKWSERENVGQTIIELLINEYEAFPRSWNIKYFIVESELELVGILEEYHINELMSNELLTYWKSLCKRSTQ